MNRWYMTRSTGKKKKDFTYFQVYTQHEVLHNKTIQRSRAPCPALQIPEEEGLQIMPRSGRSHSALPNALSPL